MCAADLKDTLCLNGGFAQVLLEVFMQVIWLTYLSFQSVQMGYKVLNLNSVKVQAVHVYCCPQTTLFCIIADKLNYIDQRCDVCHLHLDWDYHLCYYN